MSYEEDRPVQRGWETTRQRQAQDAFWRETDSPHHEGVRTCESPAVPLTDVFVPPPEQPEPTTAPERYTLTVKLSSSDGLVLSNVELIATDSQGNESRFTSDAQGSARALVQVEDVYDVRFAKTPISLPPPPLWSKDGGWGLRVARDGSNFSMQADQVRDVIVVRPAVTEILIDGYAQGSSVMRWGGMRPRLDGTIATTRAALRIALMLGRGKTMCVAGHADPLGQDTDNEALSKARATSVQLFAAGQLDDWAADAAAHATELDVGCALVACHRILGMGAAGLDDRGALASALTALQLQAGVAVHEGALTVDDWRAIAGLYAYDLATLLFTDLAGLAELQSTVKWTTPAVLALGERYPRLPEQISDLAGPLAIVQRRCSLLVFGEMDTPQLAVDAEGVELYDGTYRRTIASVPGEVLVDIAVDTPTRDPIARGRAWIDTGGLGPREHAAGPDGHIRFMTLAGDRVRVASAFDADGNGTMTSWGGKES